MMKRQGIMRNKMALIVCLLILAALFLVPEARIRAVAPSPSADFGLNELKQGCLKATIGGINLEITRYQGWIDQRKKGLVKDDALPGFESELIRLQADLEKYRTMNPADYRLPEALTLQGWFEDAKPGVNSILYFDGLSRSGPWYHLAGIAGDQYNALVPQKKYQLKIYKVYPREYSYMESAYIYLTFAAPH